MSMALLLLLLHTGVNRWPLSDLPVCSELMSFWSNFPRIPLVSAPRCSPVRSPEIGIWPGGCWSLLWWSSSSRCSGWISSWGCWACCFRSPALYPERPWPLARPSAASPGSADIPPAECAYAPPPVPAEKWNEKENKNQFIYITIGLYPADRWLHVLMQMRHIFACWIKTRNHFAVQIKIFILTGMKMYTRRLYRKRAFQGYWIWGEGEVGGA